MLSIPKYSNYSNLWITVFLYGFKSYLKQNERPKNFQTTQLNWIVKISWNDTSTNQAFCSKRVALQCPYKCSYISREKIRFDSFYASKLQLKYSLIKSGLQKRKWNVKANQRKAIIRVKEPTKMLWEQQIKNVESQKPNRKEDKDEQIKTKK